MDRATADARRLQALGDEFPARCIDIVDHQIKGRFGTATRPPRRARDDEMRSAAQLQHREIIIARDRPKTDGLEPARRFGDIGRGEEHVTDRNRWATILALRHGCLPHLSPTSLLRCMPSNSISVSMRSPAWMYLPVMRPMPLGVPVEITSPGSSVTWFEIWAICASGE